MSDPDRSKPDQSHADQSADASDAREATSTTAAEGTEASPRDAIIDGQPPHRASDPEPSSAPADAAPTEEMEPVADAPAEPEDAATEVLDPVEAQAASDEPDAPAEPDSVWMGVTAFITGALLLSPVAIVLGHLGLNAAKNGRARHRSFAVAGLVLGYVGLVATAAGVYLLLTQTTSPEEIDVQAQQDVSAVGAAAATQASSTGTVPEVEQVDAGYSVGGETIAPQLETQHALTFTGSTATDWCLEITYAGGDQTAVSYTATGGMAQGACAAQ